MDTRHGFISQDVHFDLLVKDDIRLVLLGLLAGTVQEDTEENIENVISDSDNGWQTVGSRKRKQGNTKSHEEVLLKENDEKNKWTVKSF